MRITCPVCESSYNIADEKVGAKGRAVRCASCGNKWTVMLAAEEPDDDAPVPAEATLAEAVPQYADPPTGERRRFDAADLAPEFIFPGSESASAAATVVAAAAPAAGDDHPHVDVETYAKKVRIRLSKHKPQAYLRLHRIDFERFLVRARPVFGAAVLALSLAVVGMAVLLRAPIVAAFPSLALVYESFGMKVNLRGLEIGKVEMMREVENLQPVLVVEGELENPTTAERDVPAIRFALRGDDQQEIYAWSIEPKATVLLPGANLRFRTRLASPPEQASDIQVRMIDRRKTQASAE